MIADFLIYFSMALGYLLAPKLFKKIPAISYGLFFILLLILFPTYGVLLDLLVVGKYKVLVTERYAFTYPIIIANYLTAFLFGLGLSILLSTRIQNYGIKKWLKILLYIPPVSILTLIKRLPKGTHPKFMLTRVNAPLFVLSILAIQYSSYFSGQQAWDTELNYLTSERTTYAEKIVNQIKSMEDIPYPYAKGFFEVTQLSAFEGTISFTLVESEQGSADWTDDRFLNWLKVELCFQQDIANQNRRGLLQVQVAFDVKDFEGKSRWSANTSEQLCSKSNMNYSI